MSSAQFVTPIAALRERDEQSRTRAPEATEPVRRSVASPLLVGPADDAAEHEADRVADEVISRLQAGEFGDQQHAAEGGAGRGGETVSRAFDGAEAPQIGYEGGELSDGVSSRIQQARGSGAPLPGAVRERMESAFGADLGSVRVHHGAESAKLNRTISARAFTAGQDIFFGAGEYRPDTPAGERTLAHELAHTRQQGSGVGRRVQRKLSGTADALEGLGGERGSGLKRRLVRKLKNWDRILLGVREYEALESKLYAGGAAPSMKRFLSAKPRLMKKLRNVESNIRRWLGSEANASRLSADDLHQHSLSVLNWDGDGDEPQKTFDARYKAERRQAITLLEPRVRNEVRLLSSDDPTAWTTSLGLSPDKMLEAGRTDAGQKNTVQELKYQTAIGEFQGFFKKDVGFAEEPEPHELESGIRQVDPHYGARAVAMYRLDQLFNANVTARAEFAVHKDDGGKSVLGTVLESAKGKSGGNSTIGLDREHAAALGDDAFALDDPVLQRGLNKLQLLDAIAGQLDRHGNNYYVQTDGQGGVTGVTGIDLDMAFGADMTSHDQQTTSMNYKGLPSAIDAEMGQAILRVQAADIEAALTGLLPKAEVSATVSRFESVQRRVQEADDAGELRDDWSSATTRSERLSYQDLNFGAKNVKYADTLALGARKDLRGRVEAIMRATIGGQTNDAGGLRSRTVAELNNMPPELRDEFGKAITWEDGPKVIVAAHVMNNDVPSSDVELLVQLACDAYLDSASLNDAIVAAQEAADGGIARAIHNVLSPPFKAQGFDAALRKFKQQTSSARRRGIRIGGRR